MFKAGQMTNADCQIYDESIEHIVQVCQILAKEQYTGCISNAWKKSMTNICFSVCPQSFRGTAQQPVEIISPKETEKGVAVNVLSAGCGVSGPAIDCVLNRTLTRARTRA
jgi:hypothetical protein